MKIVAFAGLPFHRWCLEDTVFAAKLLGHEVVEVEHRPKHEHHWWTGSAETLAVLRDASADADYLLVADYPYAELRPGLLRVGAKIVTVRHSLASRGNTYQPEQADADMLTLFSRMDQERLAIRKLLPEIPERMDDSRLPPEVRGRRKRRAIGTGCPWAAPMFRPRSSQDRSVLLSRLGIDTGDSRPIVAVATTWNEWTSLDVVRALAADGSRIVVWRPHWAAAWRRPGEADVVRSFGAYVDDPLVHPAGLLTGADALVGDVSGIVLLATLVRTAVGTTTGLPVEGGLPIVQIDPEPVALSSSGQLDIDGPEWTYRGAIGPRLTAATAAQRIVPTVDALLAHDPWRASRAAAARVLTEPHTTEDSPIRLVRALYAEC